MEGFDFSVAPPAYQERQRLMEILTVVCGAGWAINYITAVRLSLRQSTQVVPLIALCNNMGWESVFTTVYLPSTWIEILPLQAWVVFNIGVVTMTVKYARQPSSSNTHSPVIQKYLPILAPLGILTFFVGHLLYAHYAGAHRDIIYGGLSCQFIYGTSALALLFRRGNTNGTSYTLWFSRFVGSSTAFVGLYIRSVYWPEIWGFCDNLPTRLVMVYFFTVDLIYGGYLWYLHGKEEEQAKLKRIRVKQG